MDCLTSRNSPFSPFSEKFDAEILLSLFREGGQRRVYNELKKQVIDVSKPEAESKPVAPVAAKKSIKKGE